MIGRSFLSACLAALATTAGPVSSAAQVSGWGGDRVAVPSPNAEWFDAGRIEGEGTISIDRQSVRRENGIVRFMSRLVFDPPGANGAESFQIAEFNCARRTSRLLGVDVLDVDGRVLFATAMPADESFEPVNPEGVSGVLFGELCR